MNAPIRPITTTRPTTPRVVKDEPVDIAVAVELSVGGWVVLWGNKEMELEEVCCVDAMNIVEAG